MLLLHNLASKAYLNISGLLSPFEKFLISLIVLILDVIQISLALSWY
jgi:hypothetical protein